MLTFQNYLSQNQIAFDSLSESERKQVRADFKKVYARTYQHDLRRRMKRIEFVCSCGEYQSIKKVSKQYGAGIGVFSRKAILAYIDSDIYLPPNQTLEETKFLIRRSANNVNQLTKAGHIQKYIDNERLTALVREFQQMEKILHQFYRTPKIVFKPIHLIPNAH